MLIGKTFHASSRCEGAFSIYRGKSLSETQFSEQKQHFAKAFSELVKQAESVPSELRIKGDESLCNPIAQLNGWMVEALRRFPRFAKGTGTINYNEPVFNKVSIWLREGNNFENLVGETRELTAKINDFVNNLPEAYVKRDERYSVWLQRLSEKAQTLTQEILAIQETIP